MMKSFKLSDVVAPLGIVSIGKASVFKRLTDGRLDGVGTSAALTSFCCSETGDMTPMYRGVTTASADDVTLTNCDVTPTNCGLLSVTGVLASVTPEFAQHCDSRVRDAVCESAPHCDWRVNGRECESFSMTQSDSFLSITSEKPQQTFKHHEDHLSNTDRRTACCSQKIETNPKIKVKHFTEWTPILKLNS